MRPFDTITFLVFVLGILIGWLVLAQLWPVGT